MSIRFINSTPIHGSPDLDMASYGIVKPVDLPNEQSYKGLPWSPKESFHRLASVYQRLKLNG